MTPKETGNTHQAPGMIQASSAHEVPGKLLLLLTQPDVFK